MVHLQLGQDQVSGSWWGLSLIGRRVLAQVSATIVKPREDRPYEGFLLINSEISPMASSVYELGRCVGQCSVSWGRYLWSGRRRTRC